MQVLAKDAGKSRAALKCTPTSLGMRASMSLPEGVEANEEHDEAKDDVAEQLSRDARGLSRHCW